MQPTKNPAILRELQNPLQEWPQNRPDTSEILTKVRILSTSWPCTVWMIENWWSVGGRRVVKNDHQKMGIALSPSPIWWVWLTIPHPVVGLVVEGPTQKLGRIFATSKRPPNFKTTSKRPFFDLLTNAFFQDLAEQGGVPTLARDNTFETTPKQIRGRILYTPTPPPLKIPS